jgi:hypothetical protein
MTSTRADHRSAEVTHRPPHHGTPHAVIPDLRRHLGNCTGAEEPDALIFTCKRADDLRRANFRRATKWDETLTRLSVPNLHFHDLRHTGNTFPTKPGATLRDPIERMGHDSVQVAMI